MQPPGPVRIEVKPSLLILLTLSLAGACAVAGCHDDKAPAPAPAPTPVVPAVASTAAAPPAAASDYVPAEFKSGAARWKDIIVYVDGRPRGALSFGELPVPLEVVWEEERSSAEVRPNSDDPGFVVVRKRRYRFVDYLKAIGVDVKAVKGIAVYGPKFTDSIVATGDELRSKAGRELKFRFGGDVQGKALPMAAEGFGNGRTPDKISSVMVYVKRPPPTLVPNDGFYLDGAKVTGVPYYGEPLRGGVRVYLDNAMVAVIKRQELKPEAAEKLPDGSLRWKLSEFLTSAGVNLTGVKQGWIIRDDRRQDQLSQEDLLTATFEASPQAKGEVLLGKNKLRAQAIALHTHPITEADIPKILPDEEW